MVGMTHLFYSLWTVFLESMDEVLLHRGRDKRVGLLSPVPTRTVFVLFCV